MKTFVIKLSGAALEDGDVIDDLCAAIKKLQHQQCRVVLVHGGGKQLECRSRRVECSRDGAIEQRTRRLVQQLLVGSDDLIGIVTRESVGVERGLRHHREDRAGLGVNGYHGPLEVAQRIPRCLLNGFVDRQLDGRALRVLAGNDRIDLIEKLGVG